MSTTKEAEKKDPGKRLKLSIGGPGKMELIMHGDEEYMTNSILE